MSRLPALVIDNSLHGRVVTGAGPDGQTSTTRRDRFHLYGPVGSVLLSVRRNVGEGVLATYIVGNPFTNRG